MSAVGDGEVIVPTRRGAWTDALMWRRRRAPVLCVMDAGTIPTAYTTPARLEKWADLLAISELFL